MARHPLGRRRLAAAAALAVLGLLLAILGQASASHLNVEGDGNLVWSSAWPDSPPDPPPAAQTMPWAPWFGDNSAISFQAAPSDMAVTVSLPLAEVQGYNLVSVGESGTHVVQSPSMWLGGVDIWIQVSASALWNPIERPLSEKSPHPFTLELRDGDRVVARSATLWWGWARNDGSYSARVLPNKPTDPAW